MSTKETKHKNNEETVTENPQAASETQSADANEQTSKEQTAEERIADLTKNEYDKYSKKPLKLDVHVEENYDGRAQYFSEYVADYG